MATNRCPDCGIDHLPEDYHAAPLGELMCACADNDANWRGHGLSARYVCTCGGKTVSVTGLRWIPAERHLTMGEELRG